MDLNEQLGKGTSEFTFDPVRLEAGKARLEAWVTLNGESVGVRYVEAKLLG